MSGGDDANQIFWFWIFESPFHTMGGTRTEKKIIIHQPLLLEYELVGGRVFRACNLGSIVFLYCR